MKATDLDMLIEWLGPDGAAVGLEHSALTVPELFELAAELGLPVDRRTNKSQIINELVYRKVSRIEKPREDLLCMTDTELKRYLVERRVSRTELLRLLSDFDINPGSEDRKSLVEFAARELSDLGMYQRVAKGKQTT